MSVLHRIASLQDRRDEIPNQELARDLAEREDRDGIREIAENLWNRDPAVQSDCIKVLYEIGAIKPGLIAAYVEDFLKLLTSRQNRLVWGGMIALSAVAAVEADELFLHAQEIQKAMQTGSVITIDNGVKALALIAAHQPAYAQALFPYLLDHLGGCRPKEVPQHAEKILVAVDAANRAQFLRVLEKRMADLSPTQAGRVRRIIREAGGR
jgi:hypothetical protein